jgi:hypothetical protein
MSNWRKASKASKAGKLRANGGKPSAEDHATMTKLASVGRLGKPEEIAATAA